jgi:hypothetical protein
MHTSGGRVSTVINGVQFSSRNANIKLDSSNINVSVASNGDGTNYRTVEAIPRTAEISFDRLVDYNGAPLKWDEQGMRMVNLSVTFVEQDSLLRGHPSLMPAEFKELEIYANADLLLSGFVDGKQPKMSAEDASIDVSGRSSSGDLIDSSADHKTGRFENKDPLEIGQELSSKFKKTGFVSDQQLEKIDQYQLTPGESVFRCIEKMCRQQGMTLAGTADGQINITKAGTSRQGGALIEGQNILEGTANHSGANRHSSYKVRGQRPFDHGEQNLEIEAEEEDGAVDRYRPLIVVEDEDTSKARSKKRAKNLIVAFYFAKRGFENVARIIKR